MKTLLEKETDLWKKRKSKVDAAAGLLLELSTDNPEYHDYYMVLFEQLKSHSKNIGEKIRSNEMGLSGTRNITKRAVKQSKWKLNFWNNLTKAKA